MTRLISQSVLYAAPFVLAAGCLANPMLPTPSKRSTPPSSVLTPEQVRVFRAGEGTPESCTRLVSVSVGGNPFAQPDELRDAIREKAAELGANQVFLDAEPADRSFITAEGEQRRLLKRETEPLLTGLVCRSLSVHLGLQVNGRWEVERVFPGSQAEAAGLRAGDRIVILNERYDVSDPSAWDHVLSKSRVGDSIAVEFLDSNGNLRRRTLDLMPVDCVSAKEFRVVC